MNKERRTGSDTLLKRRRPWPRIAAIALSAAMLCTSAVPGSAAAWGAELPPDELEQRDIAGAGSAAVPAHNGELETSEGFSFGTQGQTAAGSGGASLFQAAEGVDLRTYATQADWYLGVSEMETADRLYTEKQTTDYGGNVITKTYENVPSAPGYSFVIINLALTKTVSGGSSFAADQLVLTLNGSNYSRVLDDSFLTDHDYEAFPNTEVLAGSKTGDIVFEVSTADAAAAANWKEGLQSGAIVLKAGAVTAVPAESDDSEKLPVPVSGYLVDEQYQTERELLKEYQQGNYKIGQPFFTLDPYGTTPLSGIAMFRTDSPAESVVVTVKGKPGKTCLEDITYEVPSSGTEHQIPIMGLYAAYNNIYTLSAKDGNGAEIARSGELHAQTGAAGYTAPTLESNDTKKNREPGLTVMWTNKTTVIDANADVRWYQTIGVNGVWGANNITDRGTIYFADVGTGVTSNPTIIYEMTWYGKVIAQYLQKGSGAVYPDAHHDLAESPGGTSILFGGNNDKYNVGIREIDKMTGALVRWTSASAIFGRKDTAASGDWAHLNTITSIGDDHYLLSFRIPSVIMEYDYKNDEIVWAMSEKKRTEAKFKGKTVTLKTEGADRNGFPIEYPRGQHNITLLPDLDDRPETMDVLVFDNGEGKGYSRVAHYRINKSTMQAEQVYSAGRNISGFYSGYWGSAGYLPQTGNYIGTGCSNRIVEFAPDSSVVWKVRANTDIYRCFRIPQSSFGQAEVKLGSLRGKAFMHVGDERKFVKTDAEAQEGVSVNGALIKKISLHDQQLLLSGEAYLTRGVSKNAYLVADDGKNRYYAALLTNSKQDSFDTTKKTTAPLSVAGLPKGRYNLGILVESGGKTGYSATQYYLEKTGAVQTVQTDDEGQREIVEELIAKSQDSANSLTNPVVVVNPFDKAPLSAVAAFYTPKESTVRVTVKGKPALGSRVQADVSYEVAGGRTQNHVIPIVGLYADYENTVTLEAGGQISVLRIRTGAVNQTYLREPEISSTALQKHQTAEGLTFLTPAGAQTVPYAVDVNGDIRWAYMCAAAAPLETKPLSDGHFLVPSDRASTEVFVTDAETALEIDLTGRIYGEYFLDGMPHHEVHERENGNLIFALSRRNSASIEDYMVEVERGTGREVRKWDFLKIFGIPEYDPSTDPDKGNEDPAAVDPAADVQHRAHPSIQGGASGNHPYSDWFHQNSLDYDEGDPSDPGDDAIYVTARHQSWLVKINADKAAGESPQPDAVEWIYTDPSWLPKSSLDLEPLVLKPDPEAKADNTQAALEEQLLTDAEDASPTAIAPADGTAIEEETETTAKPDPAAEQQNSGERQKAAELQETGQPEISTGTDEAAEEETDTSGPDSNHANISGFEAEAAAVSAGGGSAYPYLYGPHAVEMLDNGDLIVYDNHLYGSKTEKNAETSLFSRALRLKVNEEDKTFRIAWEYGQKLGSGHYTPFIGDVDYLGAPLKIGEEAENHYLLNFGGITKNAAGEACDVVPAMLGGSISADVMEYKDGQILWSAYFRGAPGKVSSVYRAERVDLSEIPFSSEDYASYTPLENRGNYRNTPQSQVDAAVLASACPAVIPVSWKLLYDEGNRLIGKFTLPHLMTDTAPESSRLSELYVLLDMGADGYRIYRAGYTEAQPALGVTEGYYKFEIMKDNKAAQIRLLAKRNDGVWLLGDTGEVASASMQYVTGEVPVVDAVTPVFEVTQSGTSQLLRDLADQSGSGAASLVFVAKGALEPGMKYIYRDPQTGEVSDLVYSPLHGGYLTVINGRAVTEEEAEKAIQPADGTTAELRTGIVADDRNNSIYGALRVKILPEDIFYLSNQLALGALPVEDLLRIIAMDTNGDGSLTGTDVIRLIDGFMVQ